MGTYSKPTELMAHPPKSLLGLSYAVFNREVAPTKEAVLVNWTGVQSVLSRQFRKGWGNRHRPLVFSGVGYVCCIHLAVSWRRQLNGQLKWTASSFFMAGVGMVDTGTCGNQGQLQPSNLWELVVSGTSRGSLGTPQIHIVPSWVEVSFSGSNMDFSPGTFGEFIYFWLISIIVAAIGAS